MKSVKTHRRLVSKFLIYVKPYRPHICHVSKLIHGNKKVQIPITLPVGVAFGSSCNLWQAYIPAKSGNRNQLRQVAHAPFIASKYFIFNAVHFVSHEPPKPRLSSLGPDHCSLMALHRSSLLWHFSQYGLATVTPSLQTATIQQKITSIEYCALLLL